MLRCEGFRAGLGPVGDADPPSGAFRPVLLDAKSLEFVPVGSRLRFAVALQPFLEQDLSGELHPSPFGSDSHIELRL